MSAASHPAAIYVSGEPYLRDAKGGLVPIGAIKPADLLMDELVRGLLGDAVGLSDMLTAFKREVFEKVSAHQALIAQEYGAKIGGVKGNITLTTFDGKMRVLVQVADQIQFGPEIQAAKSLIDECLSEWAATGGVELRALVNRVFQVDQQGTINRAEVFMLLRVAIEDPRWLRAMEAIGESMRVCGSKTYVRFHDRDAGDAAWQPVTLDMASA